MNIEQIHTLFKPLSPDEQKSLKTSIINLSDNPDFQLFIRDMFQKANPLAPVFKAGFKYDSIVAAKLDGEANVSRFILQTLLNQNKSEEKLLQREFNFEN